MSVDRHCTEVSSKLRALRRTEGQVVCGIGSVLLTNAGSSGGCRIETGRPLRTPAGMEGCRSRQVKGQFDRRQESTAETVTDQMVNSLPSQASNSQFSWARCCRVKRLHPSASIAPASCAPVQGNFWEVSLKWRSTFLLLPPPCCGLE